MSYKITKVEKPKTKEEQKKAEKVNRFQKKLANLATSSYLTSLSLYMTIYEFFRWTQVNYSTEGANILYPITVLIAGATGCITAVGTAKRSAELDEMYKESLKETDIAKRVRKMKEEQIKNEK